MRGMTLCFPAVDEDFWIAPPHARGRQNALTVSRRVVRITPACAGKTRSYRRSSPSRPGSPPHARGRHRRRAGGAGQARITPACAGKTARTLPSRRRAADHPRMRGEDLVDSPVPLTSRGSPPHARGRHKLLDDNVNDPRITPACAGKTPGQDRGGSWNGDHPRMRGEDCGG